METKQRVWPRCGRLFLHAPAAPQRLVDAGRRWSFLHAERDLQQCLQNPVSGLWNGNAALV
ncbi:hypothetical protein [Paracidovorax avenae]|uniref:hypothetical protein n=1 Tax=Paracidovorax avenae TaxID=80867 RepID=UPI0012602807|nr:hypothetical protein [Paracidovorax avenae]